MADNAQTQELFVITFAGETRADEVLKTLKELAHARDIALHNSAVIVRDTRGHLVIREGQDLNARQSALAGALAGGLVGMLASRVTPVQHEMGTLGVPGSETMVGGAITGALAGAGLGLIANKAIDLGFDDHYLKEIAEQLTPGSSALVAVVNFEHVEKAMQALDPYKGKILHQTLPTDVATKLAAALE